jgi:two-component system response regulator RegA
MTDSILIIDDDPTFNAVLVRALSRRGHPARGVTDAAVAVETAAQLKPGRIVLDLNIAGVSGLSLIGPLLAVLPDCRIVVLTGYASIATAVDAVKLGAVHYLAKPVDVAEILAALDSGDLPDVTESIAATPLSVDRLEWEHIQRVLHDNDGNISATARALKMHRRTLQRKLMKHPARD